MWAHHEIASILPAFMSVLQIDTPSSVILDWNVHMRCAEICRRELEHCHV